MNEMIVDKLVEKVINLIGEVNDVNLVVRGISPPQEVVNKIHERIDVLVAAIQQIEKKLVLDEGRLNALQEQTGLMKNDMKLQERAMGEMVGKVDSSNKRTGDLFYNRVVEMDT